MRLAPAVRNAKPLSECSPRELQEVASIARAHAGRRRRPQHADEFSGYVLETLVKQGTLKYNLHWLWATFLRDECGNLRSKSGRVKAQATNRPAPIEKAASVPDPAPSAATSLNWPDLLERLSPPMRAVTVLKFKWGMTDKEIGEVLGVSSQRIAQILGDLRTLGERGWFLRLLKGEAA